MGFRSFARFATFPLVPPSLGRRVRRVAGCGEGRASVSGGRLRLTRGASRLLAKAHADTKWFPPIECAGREVPAIETVLDARRRSHADVADPRADTESTPASG